MEVLSRLKESTDTLRVDSLTSADVGGRYTVVGRPSFTRISRITFGVAAFDTAVGGPGEVWIDELRLDGVRKDVGKTGNFAVQANFADVLAVNGSYSKQDQDFFRVGSGVNQGTGLNHTAVGFSSTLQLDRMLPLSGLQLPLRVTVAHSADVPKYRTGSDVILDPARSDVETRRADRQSFDFSYRRTGPRKGLTRWTIDAINGAMAYTRTANVIRSRPIRRGRSRLRATTTCRSAAASRFPWPGASSSSISRTSSPSAWTGTRHGARPIRAFIQGSQDSAALRSNALNRLLTLRTGATYLPINASPRGTRSRRGATCCSARAGSPGPTSAPRWTTRSP